MPLRAFFEGQKGQISTQQKYFVNLDGPKMNFGTTEPMPASTRRIEIEFFSGLPSNT